jgi:hypothetical protein
MHPEQNRIFQSRSPAQKLELAEMLYWEAREVKFAGLKAPHPGWGDPKIQDKVGEIFLYAQTSIVTDPKNTWMTSLEC